jgi:hypothetical protein
MSPPELVSMSLAQVQHRFVAAWLADLTGSPTPLLRLKAKRKREMKFPQQIVKSPRSMGRRSLGHLWAVMRPLYVFTVAALDPSEVTNLQYFQFVSAKRHTAPKYWRNGRYAAGRDNDPVVLVSWHGGVADCR